MRSENRRTVKRAFGGMRARNGQLGTGRARRAPRRLTRECPGGRRFSPPPPSEFSQ